MELVKKISIWMVGFSIIGMIDSYYLTFKHYSDQIVPCSVFTGCGEVLNSIYSTIYQVPVALLGFLFYIVVCLLSVIYFKTQRKDLARLLVGTTGLGFLFSLYMVFIQLFVIGHICIYCMLSAVTSTSLAILALYLVSIINKSESEAN